VDFVTILELNKEKISLAYFTPNATNLIFLLGVRVDNYFKTEIAKTFGKRPKLPNATIAECQ
jgi:hypothetical protein